MGMIRAGPASFSRSKRSRSTAVAPRENRLKFTPSGRTVAPSGALCPSELVALGSSEQFFGRGNDMVRLETKLSLKLAKRRGGSERLHADHAAAFAHVALPTKR